MSAKSKVKTTTIYLRVPATTAAGLRRIAHERGYPHTITSVARQILMAGVGALNLKPKQGS